MTLVWELPLSCTDKIVLLALADNANDEGRCFPSVQTLAKKCGLTDRGIQKVFLRLETMFLVAREERSGRSTIYTITPERYSPQNGIHPEPCSPTPEPCSPPPPNASAETPEPGSPITIRNHQIESSRNRHLAKAEQPAEFNDLKNIYPKRGGDQGWAEALRRCNAHLKRGISWVEILDGARRYAAHVRAVGNEGTQYVKSAAVFCGPDKHFLSEWPLPKNKAEALRDQNIDVSRQWLEQQEQADAPQ